MTLLAALIWLLALPGIGAALIRPRGPGLGYRLLGGGILGSALVGVTFFTLSHLGQLDRPQVLVSTALLGGLGALGWWHVLSLAEASPWISIRSYWQGLDGWDRSWMWAIGFCLLILLLDAWTPPRGADAMRYHLAQMEDMVRNHGFVFRPYYHYNFPIYYSYLMTPLYFVAGGEGVKLFNFLVVVVVAGITFALARAAGVGRPLIPVLGVLLSPGIIRAATTVNNDFGVLAFGLGGILLLHGYGRIRRLSFLILAYLAFGFAMGIKYQSVLLLPWYLWLTWVALGKRLDGSSFRLLVGLGLISVLLPAPFFVRNYLNTGVPDWPLHLEFFGAQHDFVYEMATRYSTALIGKHDFTTTLSGLLGLVMGGLTIPTMWLFSLLGIYALVRRAKDATGLYLAFGIVSQLSLWWIIQPSLYPRFVNYMIPQLMVAAVLGFEMLRSPWLRRSALVLAIASGGLGLAILAVYSQGLIRYQLDRDLDRYHEFTWFHDEYAWMDQNLPEQASVLVVGGSGHTYYMPRPYLRADPTYSGLIDWRELNSQGLYDELGRLDLDYVFYQDRDWTDSVGGAELRAVMEEFAERDDVERLWTRDVVLGTSRIRGTTMDTEAWMLRRVPPPSTGSN